MFLKKLIIILLIVFPTTNLIAAEEVNTNENQINPKTVEEWGKVGRNELCPCGSGKKYKHCHGKVN